MAEAPLRAELEESKAEIHRLNARLSTGVPTFHKDLSLISMVPKWSGANSEVPLEEFFSCIEVSASIGRWEPADQIKIATLRLTGAAKLFYNGCPELHAADVTWDNFKDAFYQTFRDAHSDQFHLMQLQRARQRKGESPREFADRCRALANKVMCKVDDPAAQRIHRENADRMMLASFVAGLSGVVGTQVRYEAPRDIGQAVSLALAVHEAEKQEKCNETFYTRFDNSVRLLSRLHSRSSRDDSKPRRTTYTQAAGRLRSQRYDSPRNSNRPSNSETRDARTQAAVRCYECQGLGHFARECPTRSKGQENTLDPRGRGSARGRSGFSHPASKNPFCREAGSERESGE